MSLLIEAKGRFPALTQTQQFRSHLLTSLHKESGISLRYLDWSLTRTVLLWSDPLEMTLLYQQEQHTGPEQSVQLH